MIRRQYRCPFCKGLFWVEIASRNAKASLPEECPLCQNTGTRTAPVDTSPPVAPYLALGKSKAADAYYRAQEEASVERVRMAAAMTGESEASLSDLKITNMKDHMEVGEIAAMPVSNEVSKVVDQHPSMFGLQTRPEAVQQAAGYAAAAHTGLIPYAGAGAQHHTRQFHSTFGTHTAANMSDNPSLEWQKQHEQPVMVRQGRRR